MQVEFATKVDSIQLPEQDGQPLVVTATSRKEGEAPRTAAFTCRLLVAADGANSIVRNALSAAQPDAGWEMEVHPSDAGGLCYKVLSWHSAVQTLCLSSVQAACSLPGLSPLHRAQLVQETMGFGAMCAA